MDWDDEPLVNTEAIGRDIEAPTLRRRPFVSFGLYDLNRLMLILTEAAALTGIILGDIWLWARV